jgi:hypothetical protein
MLCHPHPSPKQHVTPANMDQHINMYALLLTIDCPNMGNLALVPALNGSFSHV